MFSHKPIFRSRAVPAFILFMILAHGKTEAVGADGFFGMHVGNETDIPKALPVLNDLKVTWVRLWADIQWTAHTEHSSFEKAKALKAAGFKVILLLHTSEVPTYAQAKGYFDWVRERPGMKEAVDVWEILNEVNLPKYWSGTHVEYVENVLKPAWDSFHPAGELVLGASSTAWQADGAGKYAYSVHHCRRLAQAGYLDYCDFAGTHPYTENASQMISHVTEVKSVYGTKPLIATEWNLKQRPDHTLWSQELDKARIGLRGLLVTACYYRFIGFASEGGWPGVVNSQYQPQADFYAQYRDWPREGISAVLPVSERSDRRAGRSRQVDSRGRIVAGSQASLTTPTW